MNKSWDIKHLKRFIKKKAEAQEGKEDKWGHEKVTS